MLQRKRHRSARWSRSPPRTRPDSRPCCRCRSLRWHSRRRISPMSMPPRCSTRRRHPRRLSCHRQRHHHSVWHYHRPRHHRRCRRRPSTRARSSSMGSRSLCLDPKSSCLHHSLGCPQRCRGMRPSCHHHRRCFRRVHRCRLCPRHQSRRLSPQVLARDSHHQLRQVHLHHSTTSWRLVPAPGAARCSWFHRRSSHPSSHRLRPHHPSTHAQRYLLACALAPASPVSTTPHVPTHRAPTMPAALAAMPAARVSSAASAALAPSCRARAPHLLQCRPLCRRWAS